ncbi:MAG: ribosomal RNA small subunit methyltransferase A [Lentisphaerae bacterium]|nr:ribosomal RNA small subunit methyltransferase A [Lentisphaerota bacterium]
MNVCSPSAVRAVLAEWGVRPARTQGQNFLIDRNILDILLRASALRAGERVLEIGPGLGVVTEPLLQAGCRVRAVEKDRRLAEYLKQRFGEHAALELIVADALDLAAEQLLAGVDAVVSNLPYASGNRMLAEIVCSEAPPARIVVTLQRESAQRLAAAPGGRDYGLLSIWAQVRYRVRIVKRVSASCFYPAPDVQSAIVALDRRARRIPRETRERLYALTRRAFQGRRKQMGTIFGRTELGAGVDAGARPETLAPETWLELAAAGSDPR